MYWDQIFKAAVDGQPKNLFCLVEKSDWWFNHLMTFEARFLSSLFFLFFFFVGSEQNKQNGQDTLLALRVWQRCIAYLHGIHFLSVLWVFLFVFKTTTYIICESLQAIIFVVCTSSSHFLCIGSTSIELLDDVTEHKCSCFYVLHAFLSFNWCCGKTTLLAQLCDIKWFRDAYAS